jgi:hypothetical protein
MTGAHGCMPGTVSEGPVSNLGVGTKWISMTTFAISLTLVFAALSCAQEVNFKDPALIADDLRRADVVVIGTFRLQQSLPWFDGWRRRGNLKSKRLLRAT